MAVIMFPNGFTHAFFPLYAAERGVDPVGVGIYFTVFAICMGAIRPFMGSLSDRVGRVVVIVPFALLTAVGVAAFAFAGDLFGFLVAGAALGAGMGATHAALSALSMDTIQPNLRGQAVAVGGTSIDAGISAGAMGMGPVVASIGFATGFIYNGVIILAGTAVFLGARLGWKKEEKVYT